MSRLRILAVHEFYRQAGGEDVSFEAECALLEARGHHLVRYAVHNDLVPAMSKARLALTTVWSRATVRELERVVRSERPDVAHFHNTLPLISPSGYWAVKSEGVAVVQTLHNFRLSCSNGLFFRGGRICEDCVGKFAPWPAVIHRCYRRSVGASAVVAGMLTAHRLMRTYRQKVDAYIAMTEFGRVKSIESGVPSDSVYVKPHFVHPDSGATERAGDFALYVGRLSPEKGIHTLLEAAQRSQGNVPLRIVGDGPLAPVVRKAAEESPNIRWLGRRPAEEVYEIMGQAAFLVVPSEWYETFGRIVIESFMKGTPVIVAKIGALQELVDSGRTGLHFETGNVDDLKRQMEWALGHPEKLTKMRAEARAEFNQKYTAGRNYQLLMDIYDRAIARSAKHH